VACVIVRSYYIEHPYYNANPPPSPARILRHLTASAGVASNKFLAKLASDWRKPDGIYVIQPEEVDTFLLPLRVGRLPGVGKVTEEKLAKLGIKIVSELRGLELSALENLLGRYGVRVYELARH
jgi:DNA polymerase IV